MGICYSIFCDPCGRCRENGCWQGCCCCIATTGISAGKCGSVVPWWPLLSVLIFIVSGVFILTGLQTVGETVGITVDSRIINLTQASGGILVLLNLVFTYSVCSNKLRIHNAHCMPAGCRGYRIKDAQNCCSALLRLFCKMYNLIMASTSWLTLLLALVCTTLLACLSGGTLLAATLCDVSQPAIQSILDELAQMDAELQQSPVSDYVSVSSGTTAVSVCAEKWEIMRGSLYMLIGCPILLLAQVMMLVSYHVVAEVSWRHLKDERRKEEQLCANGSVGANGGSEMGGVPIGSCKYGACEAGQAGPGGCPSARELFGNSRSPSSGVGLNQYTSQEI